MRTSPYRPYLISSLSIEVAVLDNHERTGEIRVIWR